MSDQRVIIGHARHAMQAPHFDLPAGFVPLRLCIEGELARIEIACPIAIVGRHSCADLRFAFPEVSRRHCRFLFDGGQWRIHDLQSLNGVLLNDMLVVDAALFSGDRLRIGSVKLFVEAGTPKRAMLAAGDKPTQILDLVS